jgi:hypothetical protein
MADEKTLVIGNPEELGRVDTRRRFLRMLGLGGSIVLLPSLFAACNNDDVAPLGPPVRGGPSASSGVVLNLNDDNGILNYAYALEQLEAAYYTAVIAAPAFSSLSAAEQEIVGDIQKHEVIHRDFLKAALGTAAIGALAVDFSAALASRTSILTTARTFEDLGVAAYNGAGKYIRNAAYLTLAGKIVSVEARHAATIADTLDTTGTAFGDLARLATATLGASDANGLDGALEPEQVLPIVAASGTLKTNVTIGAGHGSV